MKVTVFFFEESGELLFFKLFKEGGKVKFSSQTKLNKELKQISSGKNHLVAYTTSGEIMVLGSNNEFQLGWARLGNHVTAFTEVFFFSKTENFH